VKDLWKTDKHLSILQYLHYNQLLEIDMFQPCGISS